MSPVGKRSERTERRTLRMVRTTESKYVHQKTRLFGTSITASLQTKPDFGHPRAKLISPTQKMCSSVLASKSAKRIQRNVCLAIPARTRQEGKKQNAKASKKKKFATVAVLCRSTLTFMFLQSWMSHGSMTGLMTGVVFS